jgi:hypothetical protein
MTIKTVLLQLILVTGLITASVCGAAAQWTSVGSAGTVDEADVAEYDTNGPQIRIRSTATLPAVVVVRYNVTNVNGMTGGEGIFLNVRFLDNGTGARVVTVLKQVNINTGVTTNVLSLDSNDFAASSDFQKQQTTSSCTVDFNFFENAYFIEATLSKSSSGGSPRIQALQTGASLC